MVIESENLLEEQIVADISILNSCWMIIGQQVRTAFDKYIDLLAIDASGSVIIIELKRNKTPRDVVAQAIDYASWVVDIDDSKLVDIYSKHSQKRSLNEQSLDRAFKSKLDASSERIINYLNDKVKIPVNAVFFSVFEDNGNKYLSHGTVNFMYLLVTVKNVIGLMPGNTVI